MRFVKIQIIILFFSIIILIFFMANLDLKKDCYYSKAILHNQKVGELNGCCNHCLIFNVTEFVCNKDCGCDWQTKKLYFEKEYNLRLDLKNNSKISIFRCKDSKSKEYFIRGIK